MQHKNRKLLFEAEWAEQKSLSCVFKVCFEKINIEEECYVIFYLSILQWAVHLFSLSHLYQHIREKWEVKQECCVDDYHKSWILLIILCVSVALLIWALAHKKKIFLGSNFPNYQKNSLNFLFSVNTKIYFSSMHCLSQTFLIWSIL